MIASETIIFFSLGYIGLLFGIAYYGDKRADMGRSIISNPYIYALSLAVYCTAWTFYGSVGRSARTGLGFLPIYIGPTLTAALGWVVWRKIIRISKAHRITSIADFIASRYGKSTTTGGVVTLIAVLGVVPYISLQLKAISVSFFLISQYPLSSYAAHFTDIPVLQDTAFYIALILAVFAILFGTRHLEATERHEGLVAAIAFESIVKLFAFLAVGIFVTYGIYKGFQDIIQRAGSVPELRELFTIGAASDANLNWTIHIFLSMMAVMFLPRQFQVAVVENVNEHHLNKAIWLFPLYLLAINLFVLPVALGGSLHFRNSGVDADTFVLTLPLTYHQHKLAFLVYVGGLSAATGMVIVETVALSTMICNDLVMPVLLRMPHLNLHKVSDMSHLLLSIRRGGIVVVLMLGYLYFRFIGEFYTLVSIGLVSFAAVVQFAPAIIGGIFWKGATRVGALAGLLSGFCVWGYTLVIPSLAQVAILPESIITDGLFGIGLLRPHALFGLQGFDPIAHAVFWSMLANISAYIGFSLFSQPTTIEHTQAALFVDVFRYSADEGKGALWRGTASLPDLRSLLRRFLGAQRADEALAQYAAKRNINWFKAMTADAELVSYVEKLLAGAIGSASAHVMVSSVVKAEPVRLEEVMDILDETRQVIAYSHELEKTTAELKAANERLKELDRLKDEFISTVTHELRTPITSVRALAEILRENPKLEPAKHYEFAAIIVKESERLTRLINQVLDFHKIESGRVDWQISSVNLKELVVDALTTNQQLIQERDIQLVVNLPDDVPLIPGDRDRLMQVIINLISNAVKFCDNKQGVIDVGLNIESEYLRVDVADNGIGVRLENQQIIFDEFRQVKEASRGRPAGTGLGLAIAKRIIDFHRGTIWVESVPGEGARFSFRLPLKLPPDWHREDAGVQTLPANPPVQ